VANRINRITGVIEELEFEAKPTREDRIMPCRHCLTRLPHAYSGGMLMPIKHDAPCGLPCLAGGVDVGTKFHDNQCELCRK